MFCICIMCASHIISVMSFCVVTGCTNRRNNKNYVQLEKEKAEDRKFSLHLFPRDIKRKHEWLEALNLRNYSPPKTAAVCSVHFKEENYEQNLTLKRLKKDAIPYLSEEEMARTRDCRETINIEMRETDNQNTDSIESLSTDSSEVPTCSKIVHRSTSVSPERIFNSPIKARLRKIHTAEMKSLKRKLTLSDYNQKQMRTKIQSLKSVLKDLMKRSLITPDDNEILQQLDKGTKELITRELMFGCIRSYNEYNNNPTVKQFKSAFKKLIIHTELRENTTGNCIPLEEIPILHMSSKRDSINTINETSNQNLCDNWLNVFDTTNDIDTTSDHDYFSHTEFPFVTTEYKKESITYIAGYILRRLMNKLHCIECVRTLIEQNTDDNNYNFINIKNKGSLIYPSKDLVYVCKTIEHQINIYIHTNKTLNNFNMRSFVSSVMRHFVGIDIFIQLKQHINDQCFASNHINHLLRAIIELYSKMRLMHYIQNVKISDRHKLHKLILFKGQ